MAVKETITVLMSHSQFRSRILILRHAWLNLWDKHMTTGRINQVITKPTQPSNEESWVGRQNRIQQVGHFQFQANHNWNIKCQAYNCDWETNLMQTTVKKHCIKIHSHQGLNDRSLTGMKSNQKTATTHPKPHWF